MGQKSLPRFRKMHQEIMCLDEYNEENNYLKSRYRTEKIPIMFPEFKTYNKIEIVISSIGTK